MKKAVIVAFEDFTDVDIFLSWDILNRVKRFKDDFQVKIVGTRKCHKSVFGIDLKTQGVVEECNDADLVMFGSGPGARKLIRDTEYLKRFQLFPEKQLICSICSGSLIIAALGHLKGIPSITHPSVLGILQNYDADVIYDKHLVIHNNIATAAGCLASIDLMGWAIGRLYDNSTKEAILSSIMPVGKQSFEFGLKKN